MIREQSLSDFNTLRSAPFLNFQVLCLETTSLHLCLCLRCFVSELSEGTPLLTEPTGIAFSLSRSLWSTCCWRRRVRFLSCSSWWPAISPCWIRWVQRFGLAGRGPPLCKTKHNWSLTQPLSARWYIPFLLWQFYLVVVRKVISSHKLLYLRHLMV